MGSEKLSSTTFQEERVCSFLYNSLRYYSHYFSFTFYDINKQPDNDIAPKPKDILTIHKDTVNDDYLLLDGAGDTLFFKRDDSVLINKKFRESKNDLPQKH